MTILLLFLSTNNDLFLLFWNTIFFLYWNTISRSSLWRYLSGIKGAIRDWACSGPTPTTTAVLLITLIHYHGSKEWTITLAVWQVNHKPTVWPNTQRRFSLFKRVNIFINVEVQWPLPVKTILRSTCVSNQVYGRIQFLSYRSSGWSIQ